MVVSKQIIFCIRFLEYSSISANCVTAGWGNNGTEQGEKGTDYLLYTYMQTAPAEICESLPFNEDVEICTHGTPVDSRPCRVSYVVYLLFLELSN